MLGSALGESLVAADLAVIIAHKRQATLQRAPSSIIANLHDDRFKSVDAHRCTLNVTSRDILLLLIALYVRME